MCALRRLGRLWVLGMVVLGVLAGCQSRASSEVVMIATDATWPPFEYVDPETREIVGFDIDLMRAIAEAAGLEVQITNVSWDALLAGVSQGQYDAAISVITITEERRQQMLFSEPYYNAGQVLVVRAGETRIQAQADLAGRLAGAQLGTTGAMAIQEVAGAMLKTYDTIDLAFLDLLNGQIDAVVVDNPLAMAYAAQYAGRLEIVGEPFTDEWYGIAVAPGGEALLARINAGLAEVQASGDVEVLAARWLAASSTTPSLPSD